MKKETDPALKLKIALSFIREKGKFALKTFKNIKFNAVWLHLSIFTVLSLVNVDTRQGVLLHVSNLVNNKNSFAVRE